MEYRIRHAAVFLLLGAIWLGACAASRPADAPGEGRTSDPGPLGEDEIITLLARNAIPAIDDSQFQSAAQADGEYGPSELVLGVEIEGEARAYSTDLLSRHEIVNDTVRGHPISMTW